MTLQDGEVEVKVVCDGGELYLNGIFVAGEDRSENLLCSVEMMTESAAWMNADGRALVARFASGSLLSLPLPDDWRLRDEDGALDEGLEDWIFLVNAYLAEWAPTLTKRS